MAQEEAPHRFALLIKTTPFPELFRQLTRRVSSDRVEGVPVTKKEGGQTIVLENERGEFPAAWQTFVNV